MRTAHLVLLMAVAAICTLDSPRAVVAANEPKNALSAEVLKAFTAGEYLAVMSIDPKGIDTVPAYSWQILARSDDHEEAVQKEIVGAVKKAVEEGREMADCFQPRHAISVEYKERTYLLLICFECSQAIVYVDGVQKQTVAISNSAKAVLDKALAAEAAESDK